MHFDDCNTTQFSIEIKEKNAKENSLAPSSRLGRRFGYR